MSNMMTLNFLQVAKKREISVQNMINTRQYGETTVNRSVQFHKPNIKRFVVDELLQRKGHFYVLCCL